MRNVAAVVCACVVALSFVSCLSWEHWDNQFKRSAVPNAPKVGSGGSLSPRGDWRAPSDASANAWLKDLARVPAKE